MSSHPATTKTQWDRCKRQYALGAAAQFGCWFIYQMGIRYKSEAHLKKVLFNLRHVKSQCSPWPSIMAKWCHLFHWRPFAEPRQRRLFGNFRRFIDGTLIIGTIFFSLSQMQLACYSQVCLQQHMTWFNDAVAICLNRQQPIRDQTDSTTIGA